MPQLLGSKKFFSALLISSFGILRYLWEANSSQRQIEHLLISVQSFPRAKEWVREFS